MAALMVIPGRAKDLGGFSVRRVLPYVKQRMVGPFVFLDHMGPAEFTLDQAMNVRPHPHIHLATVTYLFEGKIRHRDSLGSDQMIEPGAINWMNAGHGIVHSERTPKGIGRMEGLQCWVALPEAHEDSTPSFTHYPSHVLPEFSMSGTRVKLLAGSLFDHTSPVQTFSDLFYAEIEMQPTGGLTIPAEQREAALYVAHGQVQVAGTLVEPYNLVLLPQGQASEIVANGAARVMLLGGSSLGPRHLYWNFVSSREDNIAQAKLDWANGPGTARFPKVTGDELEYIPLPTAAPASPRL